MPKRFLIVSFSALIAVVLGGATLFTFVATKPITKLAKIGPIAVNAATLKLPCAWIEGVDHDDVSFGTRVRLNPFSAGGKATTSSDPDDDFIIWYEARQDLALEADLFRSFGLNRDYFDRLQLTPVTINIVDQFLSSRPRRFVLVLDRAGDEWTARTFHDSNLNPMPDGKSSEAMTVTWWFRFEPGDSDVPSFLMSCNGFARCLIEMMHKSLAVKVFVDKALVVDHRRIVAAVRSITDAILAGSLLPDQKSIPCLIAGKCLKEE